MAVVGHHLLLGIALAALGGFALRVASLAVPGGSLRVLAAAPVLAAAMVLEALVLGLAGLGTSPVALTVAAVATWGAGFVALPAPAVSPRAELAAWWEGASAGAAAGAGAALALAVACAVWLARDPFVGPDGLAYHLPDVLGWIQDGRPGARNAVVARLPVENYPLTNEVLLAWPMGIARDFTVLAPFQVAFAVLLAGSVLAGLRRLGVAGSVRVAAVVALLACPLVVAQLNGVSTDLAALAWLACCAALCLGVRDRPALFALALLAAGLAVGTKTTTLVPAVLALGFALVVMRRGASAKAAGQGGGGSGWADLSWRAVSLAALAAVGVGGVWYLRNLVSHGSPLWPLVAAPWGDDVPPFLERFDSRFVDDPAGTWDARAAVYRTYMAGGLALLAAGVLAPLVSRRRAVLGASAAALGLTLLWTLAPYTGLSDRADLQALGQSTYRYLLPAILAATLALALAARGRAATIVVLAVLVGSTAWSAVEVLDAGSPFVPSAWLVLASLAGGAILGLLAIRVPFSRYRRLNDTQVPVGALVAVVGALLLVPAAENWTRRHALTEFEDHELVRWIVEQPGFEDGDDPVAQTPIVNAALAGDRLRHPIPLVTEREGCAALRARARTGWVVVRTTPVPEWEATRRPVERCLREESRPVYESALYRVYRARAPTGRAMEAPPGR